MKYENFKEAKSIVEQIDRKIEYLNNLRSDNLTLKLVVGSYCFSSIGTWSSCEHDFQPDAAAFIRSITKQTENEIEDLKAELIKL